MAGDLVAAVILIVIVALVVLLRKRFIQLLLDLMIGTLVYLSAIFIIGWIGIKLPLTIAEWGYPIMLLIFVIYHILSNLNTGTRNSRPFGSL